jgi:murein DD-endopeptidase MepM/ murein hydrolase activator NlpD
MEEGVMQAYMDGISTEENLAFEIAEGYLKDNDDQIQGIGDSAQATGAPFMGVQKIRELSGWKAYGYAMGMAQNAGHGYGAAMEQALADVPEDISAAEKAVYLSNARAQFMRQAGLLGMNPALLNKYAFPGMREADSVIMNKWRKQEEDTIKAQYIDEAQTVLGADPVGNFSKAIDMMVRGGIPRGKARAEILGMLESTEDINAVGSSISWDGRLTWEEKYPIEFRNARRKANQQEIDNYNLDKAQSALEGKQWFDQLQEMWEQEPPTDEELAAAERYMSDNFDYVDSRLGERWKSRTTDAESKEYYRDQFDALERAGQLTEAMLNDPAVPSDVRRSFLAQAQAQDKARRDTPEFKQYTKELEETLKRNAKQEGLQPSVAGLELAIARAQGDFQRHFTAALQGGASASQAAANAFALVNAEIQRGVGDPINKIAGTGVYAFDDTDGFTGVIPKAFQGNWQRHKANIDNILSAGSTTIDTHALIPEATLKEALKGINSPNYQYPAIATYISDRFGGKISPWEVINRQLKARGLGELPTNPNLQPSTQGIRPEMMRLLHYRPSYNRVTRAYESAGSLDTAAVPFSGVLSLLRSGEGGWDSANRGRAGDTPGGVAGLSRKTLGQWKQLQAQGYFALGAYQFIPETLRLAAGEAGINDSTVMTPAVQDRLAVQLMIGSKRPRLAAYLRGQNDDIGAALDDLALEWASVHTARGGTAYAGIGGNAASISRNSAAQQLQRAKQLFLSGSGGSNTSPWRNPALLNPRVAYITGNIGPGSTGPHLDVKRTDRGRFSENALDRYVEIDDPQFGRISPGDLRRKLPGRGDDFDGHVARNSHGIDYPTASGSRVYLKGGAKVIAAHDSGDGNGDLVTIQLPNGQKYTFLHGRKA